MENKELSTSVLKKIKEKHINPTPKWKHQMKNYTYWSISGIILIIGSITSSVIIYFIVNNDWDIYSHADKNVIGFAIKSLPYVWIVVALLFVGLVYINFKHTKGGYKYRLTSIVLGSVVVSIVVGWGFAAVGFASTIDQTLSKSRLYHELFCRHNHLWQNPEKGLLVGEVTEMEDETQFILEDIKNQQWLIIKKVSPQQRQPVLMKGIRIKVIGSKLDEAQFEAARIRPTVCGNPKPSCGCNNNERKLQELRINECTGEKNLLWPHKILNN